jgi:hypothetical protein
VIDSAASPHDDNEDPTLDQLYELAYRLGIKNAAVREALEDTPATDLLARWRKTYNRLASGIRLRAERQEMDQMVTENADRYLERRREFVEERRTQRERMTLGGRLDALLAATVREPGAAAVSYDGDRVSGGEGLQAPTDPQMLTVDNLTLEMHWLWFQTRIERLEAGWDEFRGLGSLRDWTSATKEEKDREILSRYRGVHSSVVAQIAPYLGSKRTIEQVRYEMGLRGSTGDPK